MWPYRIARLYTYLLAVTSRLLNVNVVVDCVFLPSFVRLSARRPNQGLVRRGLFPVLFHLKVPHLAEAEVKVEEVSIAVTTVSVSSAWCWMIRDNNSSLLNLKADMPIPSSCCSILKSSKLISLTEEA